MSGQLGLSEEIFVLDLWTGTLNVNTTLVTAFTAAILVTPLGALSVVSTTLDPTDKGRITSPDLACCFKRTGGLRDLVKVLLTRDSHLLRQYIASIKTSRLHPLMKREYLDATGLAGLCIGYSRGHHLSVSTTIFTRQKTGALKSDTRLFSLNAPETQSAETIPVFQKLWVVSPDRTGEWR